MGLELRTLPGSRSSRGMGVVRTRAMSTARRAPASGFTGARSRSSTCPTSSRKRMGNKADTRWAAITNLRGEGLLCMGMPVINVSVHHYTTEDLTASARIRHELTAHEETVVHLDCQQGGLGSNSCGPRPLPHLLQPVEMSFAVRIKPFSMDALADVALEGESAGPRTPDPRGAGNALALAP